jgi:hypothetical protein
MDRRRLLPATLLAGLLVAAVAAPLTARTQDLVPYTCRPPAAPCARVANAFIRADIGPNGAWVVGTTGGDPDTPLDDDRRLLYGFKPGGNSDIASSFTTLRIVGPTGTVDDVPESAASQRDLGDRVETVWRSQARYRVRVTETLRIVQNAYSGRPDAVSFRYTLHNQDVVPLEVGIRTLLDVRIGDNDGAPYILPGVGAVTREQEFGGAARPPFWLAFESPLFDPARLRGIGILDGPGLTPPDRMVIARWPHIMTTKWDYAITPTEPVTTDSAVALYWDPAALQPGALRAIQGLYGVAGNRGGSAFVTAPVLAECGSTFVAALFVNNFQPTPLTGGLATIVLPPGLRLVPGEAATKPLSTIDPAGTGSATWSIEVAYGDRGQKTVTAFALFDGGQRYDARADVNTVCVPTPTATLPPPPTATHTPPPTRTPRATASPTPFGTPAAEAHACDFVLRRVPRVAIDAALANPAQVRGWLEPLNPGLPIGPGNPLKTWLSLQNIAAPYHPLFNALVFKVGCP